MKPLFLRYGDEDEASQCKRYGDNDDNDDTIDSKIWR